MPLPNDELNRWWVDVEVTDPAFSNSLRSSLVAFLTLDRNRNPIDLGSGFIIAAQGNWALAVTAKHVIIEFAARVQGRRQSAPSALFAPPNEPSLHPGNIRAFWLSGGHANALEIKHVEYNENIDIALCVLKTQEAYSNPFEPVAIPLDTGSARSGDEVFLVSCGITPAEEIEPPLGRDGIGQKVKLENGVAIRAGVVTGVYHNGYRQYRWPCFTTSIPAEPGMSGGFIYRALPNSTVQALGVICADNSDDAAVKSYLSCGESVVGSAWSALALSVLINEKGEVVRRTLFDLMQRGSIPAPSSLGHISIVSLDNGGYTITCRG